MYLLDWPVPVAARSKAWFNCRSLSETVGSHPAGGMDVCREWCQVEVSVWGWLVVQRSTTSCGVPRPTRGCWGMKNKFWMSLEMNDAKIMLWEIMLKVNAVFLAVLLRYLEILSLILVPETGWHDIAYGFSQPLQHIPRLFPSRSLTLRQL